ncbi:MAG: DUF1015 domain-containing protein [Actinobacteria bacterium]|nr:DUF1015 domain-containing protein [Actinomycetota bacterium]
MPRFEPFAGLCYNPSKVTYDDVIAPPYDVVDEDERAALAGRSPFNAIAVELPEDDPSSGLDRYQAAASLFGQWQQDHVLIKDQRPCLYAYRMTFIPEDGPGAGHGGNGPDHMAYRATLGVIGALEVVPPGHGEVLPHEQTMSKPKSDRLDLLRATRINTSPVWGLSLASGLSAAIAGEGASGAAGPKAIDRPAEIAAVDSDGVLHELWKIKDADQIQRISELVRAAPVVIADGHHRYETANAYKAQLAATGQEAAKAAELVMTYVVELAEDQLTVGPIHRLISGLPSGYDLQEGLSQAFQLSRLGPDDQLKEKDAASSLTLVTQEGSYNLTPTKAALDNAEDPELDSSVVAYALASLPDHELSYQHGRQNALAAVAKGDAQAAILLRPVSIAKIASMAERNLRMPPKSTFFYPKPRTGMVFRPLDPRQGFKPAAK